MKYKYHFKKASYLLLLLPAVYGRQSDVYVRPRSGTNSLLSVNKTRTDAVIAEQAASKPSTKQFYVPDNNKKVAVITNRKEIKQIPKTNSMQRTKQEKQGMETTNSILSVATRHVAEEQSFSPLLVQFSLVVTMLGIGVALLICNNGDDIVISILGNKKDKDKENDTDKKNSEIIINNNRYSYYFLLMGALLMISHYPIMHSYFALAIISLVVGILVSSSMQTPSWEEILIVLSHIILSLALLRCIGLRREPNLEKLDKVTKAYNKLQASAEDSVLAF